MWRSGRGGMSQLQGSLVTLPLIALQDTPELLQPEAFALPRALLPADGQGSFSPHQKMPFAFAVAAGLSDAGMQMAIRDAEGGGSLRGNGYANTKEVRAGRDGGGQGPAGLDLARPGREAWDAKGRASVEAIARGEC